jgi:fructosamine-3-kinase
MHGAMSFCVHHQHVQHKSTFLSLYRGQLKVHFVAGFEDRVQLYQLYHYLNHYNLFGGGYRGSADSILRRLVDKYA